MRYKIHKNTCLKIVISFKNKSNEALRKGKLKQKKNKKKSKNRVKRAK